MHVFVHDFEMSAVRKIGRLSRKGHWTLFRTKLRMLTTFFDIIYMNFGLEYKAVYSLRFREYVLTECAHNKFYLYINYRSPPSIAPVVTLRYVQLRKSEISIAFYSCYVANFWEKRI